MGEAIDGQAKGLDRREMLKRSAIVAAGAGAAVWAAPRIEALGVAPAGAQTTIPASQLIILSPQSDDKNQNNGQHDCVTPTPPGHACCSSSFGDAGKADTFTFVNPWPNCSQVVVRTETLDCSTTNDNPDVGQFAVTISSHAGTDCRCRVFDAVLIASSGRAVLQHLNNGPACGGVDASVACNNPLLVSSTRLAVELTCSNALPAL
jgi:hypothetical protein